MNKTGIIGIGTSGLIGSRVTELLGSKYDFMNLGITSGVDITKPETLKLIEENSSHKYVLHLAAKADVDGCEKDKDLGENGPAWQINVKGVENVLDACRKNNKTFVYVSTDFVFDGENTPDGGYTEDDTPNPINWYAKTKHEGEKRVINSGIDYIILRTAYPYRKKYEEKKDFVRAILDRLKNGDKVVGVTDHIMTPTFIDDFAHCLEAIVDKTQTGIFNVVGSQSLSPYDAVLEIVKAFNITNPVISKTTREEFFRDRAARPFNLSLNNAKIQRLGVFPLTFTEGLEELK